MEWLVGVLAGLALLGAVLFGAIGGLTAVLVIVVMIVAGIVFRERIRGA